MHCSGCLSRLPIAFRLLALRKVLRPGRAVFEDALRYPRSAGESLKQSLDAGHYVSVIVPGDRKLDGLKTFLTAQHVSGRDGLLAGGSSLSGHNSILGWVFSVSLLRAFHGGRGQQKVSHRQLQEQMLTPRERGNDSDH